MSIFEQVIVLTRKLEGILEKEFQAVGRGLHEKASSVENHLPAPLMKKLRYIATVRNKLMHEEDFVISQPDDFVRTAEQAISELQTLAENKAQQSRVTSNRPASSNSNSENFAAIAIVAAIALIVGVFFLYSFAQNILDPIENRKARAAEVAKKQRAEKQKKYLEYRQATQRPKTQHQSQHTQNLPVKSDPKPNNTAPNISSSEETKPAKMKPSLTQIQPSDHHAIENDALSITDVRFSFKRGSFNRTEANITVTAKNMTDEYISSAQLHARLYIPGKESPAVDTRSGFRSNTLSLFFGDYGLKPGESITKNIYLGAHSERDWTTPDILNANKHLLILDVVSFYDGMNQKKPTNSKGFGSISLPNALNSQPKKLAQPEVNLPNIDHLKAQFDQGKSVGIGNDKLEFIDASIKYERGSFNRIEPKLTITVRNQSSLTFSHAMLHAQLYTNGNSQPILKTKKPFYLFFDERGLTPNATTTKQISLSGFDYSEWTAPDILNANRKQVMIKINSINDGSNNTITDSSSAYLNLF